MFGSRPQNVLARPLLATGRPSDSTLRAHSQHLKKGDPGLDNNLFRFSYFSQAVEREKEFANRVVGIALADSFLDFGSNARPSVISLFAKVGGSHSVVAVSYSNQCVSGRKPGPSMQEQRTPDNLKK